MPDYVITPTLHGAVASGPCTECGKDVAVPASRLKASRNLFCGLDCRAAFFAHRRVSKTCPQCGQCFSATTASLEAGGSKFCSSTCAYAFRRAEGVRTFWARIRKDGDCWIWTGPINSGNGYGRTRRDGKAVLAHRLAYELAFGPIPGDLWVLHRCDTPLCVRPDHLFLGTAADNTADMVAKGRNCTGEQWQAAHPPSTRPSGDQHPSRLRGGYLPKGSEHGRAKTTEAEVLEIRRLYAAGVPQVRLAQDFGLSLPQIGNIVRRRQWTHI